MLIRPKVFAQPSTHKIVTSRHLKHTLVDANNGSLQLMRLADSTKLGAPVKLPESTYFSSFMPDESGIYFLYKKDKKYCVGMLAITSDGALSSIVQDLYEINQEIMKAFFSTDNNYLAILCKTQDIHKCDLILIKRELKQFKIIKILNQTLFSFSEDSSEFYYSDGCSNRYLSYIDLGKFDKFLIESKDAKENLVSGKEVFETEINFTKFAVHTNKKLFAIIEDCWTPQIGIYNRITKQWVTRIRDITGEIAFIDFMPNSERFVYAVSSRSVDDSTTFQESKESKINFKVNSIEFGQSFMKLNNSHTIFVKDLVSKKACHMLLDGPRQIGNLFSSKDGQYLAASGGHEIYLWHVPPRLSKWERLTWQPEENGGPKLRVTGVELLAIARDAVREIIKPFQGHKFTKNDEAVTIVSGHDWLGTAGHLSEAITGGDVRKEQKFFPGKIVVADAKQSVLLHNKSIVSFSMCKDGSYPAVAHYLEGITGGDALDASFDDFVKVFSGTNFEKTIRSKHQDIAIALLLRIAGHPYPAFLQNHTHFLDSLLVLMVGVEGSRNNTTFLTAIMLLDLIAAYRTYGRLSRLFTWDNAFTSGPGYRWDEYAEEKKGNDHQSNFKDYGGKFPMATNNTGTGNLSNRRSILDEVKKSPDNPKGKAQLAQQMYKLTSQHQHHRVALREMSIIKHWLKALPLNKQGLIQECKGDPAKLRACLKNIFEDRLKSAYYESVPTLRYLQLNLKGMGVSNPRLILDQKDKRFFFLEHRAKSTDGKYKTQDAPYYHRLDVPCKLVSEHIRDHKQKELYTGQKLTAKIHLAQRHLYALHRQVSINQYEIYTDDMHISIRYPNINISSLEKKYSDLDCSTPEINQKIWKVVSEFIQCELAYTNLESLKEKFDLYWEKEN